VARRKRPAGLAWTIILLLHAAVHEHPSLDAQLTFSLSSPSSPQPAAKDGAVTLFWGRSRSVQLVFVSVYRAAHLLEDFLRWHLKALPFRSRTLLSVPARTDRSSSRTST
jgi:hypothetical protein